MSVVLILTPVIIGSWPTITAAIAGAATAMGLVAARSAKETAKAVAEQTAHVSEEQAEVVIAEDLELAQNMATDEEIVLVKDNVTLTVRRDARGRCTVCAKGHGHTKTELRAMAEEFTQRLTQCFIYNRVMSEVKAKGFQVVNEEQTEDESVRIHLRRWEG